MRFVLNVTLVNWECPLCRQLRSVGLGMATRRQGNKRQGTLVTTTRSWIPFLIFYHLSHALWKGALAWTAIEGCLDDGLKDEIAGELLSLVLVPISSNSCGRPRVSQPVRNKNKSREENRSFDKTQTPLR